MSRSVASLEVSQDRGCSQACLALADAREERGQAARLAAVLTSPALNALKFLHKAEIRRKPLQIAALPLSKVPFTNLQRPAKIGTGELFLNLPIIAFEA